MENLMSDTIKAIAPSDVEPCYRPFIASLKKELAPVLRHLNLIPRFNSFDEEEGLIIEFCDRRDTWSSYILLTLPAPEAGVDRNFGWADVVLHELECGVHDIGHNGWLVYYGCQGDDPIPAKAGRSEEQIIADTIKIIREKGTLCHGADVPGWVNSTEFADVWLDDHLTLFKDVKVERNRRGTESYVFKDAQDRVIKLALPRDSDRWTCYVDDRVVGRGSVDDLIEKHARTEAKDDDFDDDDFGYSRHYR